MNTVYEAILIRVIDGDTVIFDLSKSYKEMGYRITKTYHNIYVRFRDIDTPERGKPGYYDAKGHVWDRLEEGNHIQVITDDTVGGFKRLLGTILVDGTDLNRELLELGLAIPYVK